MAEEPEKLEVTVQYVREYTVGPVGGPQTKLHDILFQAPGMVPLLVTLRAEEDTPETRAAAIRKAIDEEKAREPETIRV